MTLSYPKRILLAAGLLTGLLILHARFDNPRVLAVNEVPVAFWAWRTQAPENKELNDLFAKTKAKALFLRAGQLDSVDGDIRRIRPVSGTIPTGVELHLVYNATRRFLEGFESVETGSIVESIAATYQVDISRAETDGARVHGLQLDLDVPSRLLPKYAQVLRHLRETLATDQKLSITGLPTWTTTTALEDVLSTIDFWTPQLYGGKIPTDVSQRIPISSASDVARTVSVVRRLNKPFYAGLSAYGYAILYGKDGRLLELRGDIDPALAAKTGGLELVKREQFRADGNAAQTRYEYRAKNDVVIDGLILQSGQTLVFDLPNAASLRAGARAVRENAGENLLGICLFRLPVANDKAVLGVSEIVTALADEETRVKTDTAVERLDNKQVRLRAENIGTARTIQGGDAFTIDIDVKPGSVKGVTRLSRFTSFETLCRTQPHTSPQPCSETRANLIRLKISAWEPGTEASCAIAFDSGIPAMISMLAATHVDDGRLASERFELTVIDKKNE